MCVRLVGIRTYCRANLVHIWLTIPSYENIVVNNSASDDARHEHAEVAIKDAFAAARRQVDDLEA
jgi:hypothetical protein